MEPNESARLIEIEERLLGSVDRDGSPDPLLGERQLRGFRLRSDSAIRHAEQLVHCLKWLRQDHPPEWE